MKLNQAFIPLIWIIIIGFVVVVIGGRTYLTVHNLFTPSPTPISTIIIPSIMPSSTVTPSTSALHDLSSYPDEPINFDLAKPISVQTLIFHRSALRLKTVTIHAFVVDIQKGWCPGPGVGLRCSGPHLTIADSLDPKRDRSLDISFELQILGNQPIPYIIGEEVYLSVIVYSSKSSVNLQITFIPAPPPDSCLGNVCTSNTDCPHGMNGKYTGCWYKVPLGPDAGIPGSPSQPGRCWLCATTQ